MVQIIAVSLLVGFLCGCTSVGGVLLIPAMDAFSSLGLRMVMGTVLFGFFFSGLLGTYLHSRKGSINWRAALPLCLGAAATSYAGALAKEYVAVPSLNNILAVIIIVAGVTSLRPVLGLGRMAESSRKIQDAGLFLIGASVGFFSGLTGAGGPVLSVPMMLIAGYQPLLAVAVAQPFQSVIAFFGSIGNMSIGGIDYRMGFIITLPLLLGVLLGIYSLKFLKPKGLKMAVSAMCIATGAYMLAKSFF